MISRLRSRVLPESQRRTLEEVAEDLELRRGDTRSKQSAYWTMLTLSGLIATAGVLNDSTATVIGAMIIAPLSTPIMGIAVGVVQRRRNGSVPFVFFGCLLVIVLGVLFSVVLPGSYNLLANNQISSRTSPGLLDLIAALATGLAGAVALARRDVGAVLPGVAIAISLVPPLAVVGVCAGRGSWLLALGATLLFLSNLLALALSGMLMFTALGYATETAQALPHAPRRVRLMLTLLVSAVTLPLVANTGITYLTAIWTERVQTAATAWVRQVPGAEVTSVSVTERTIRVNVRTPSDLPPVDSLLADLNGQIPNGIPVVVESTRGRQVEAGTVGGG
ncbi:DUF389 domain-containing protein [Streptomyces sp. MUM 203J]|nr:DUF389 domain-containing protein [Streptomyces sp. MUM 203J]